MGTEQRSNARARLVPGASPAGAATMRAAVKHRYGPPSVLESSEVGIPLPGPGDVLVQVGAAAVHPGDYFVIIPIRSTPSSGASAAIWVTV